jgi:hypothetical protein
MTEATPMNQLFGAVLVLTVGCGTASAQSVTAYSSSSMWGTASSGNAVPGAAESAGAHFINGNIAGQVNAARRGALINSGSTFVVTTIGSQNVITNTITGSGNIVSVEADQDSESTGDISSDAEFNFTQVDSDVWNISVGN